MQWTVQYFIHKAKWWKSMVNAGPGATDNQLTPGAIAYAHRKASMWYQLAIVADNQYKSINVYYQSIA